MSDYDPDWNNTEGTIKGTGEGEPAPAAIVVLPERPKPVHYMDTFDGEGNKTNRAVHLDCNIEPHLTLLETKLAEAIAQRDVARQEARNLNAAVGHKEEILSEALKTITGLRAELVDALAQRAAALRAAKEWEQEHDTLMEQKHIIHPQDLYKIKTQLRNAEAALAEAVAQRDVEKAIVARVWKALEIQTYEDAKGRTIDQIVSELRTSLAALEEKYDSAKDEWTEDLRTANEAMDTKNRNRSNWKNERAEKAETALAESHKQRDFWKNNYEDAEAGLADSRQKVCDFQAASMLNIGPDEDPSRVEPNHVEAHVTDLREALAVEGKRAEDWKVKAFVAEAGFAAMTIDRNLWQDAHDEDCPNKVALEEETKTVAELRVSQSAYKVEMEGWRERALTAEKRREASAVEQKCQYCGWRTAGKDSNGKT